MYEYKAICKRVIDGDTVVVDIYLGFHIIFHDQYLRLFGINAPETRGKSKVKGLKSKRWLKKRIEGKEVIIWTIKDKKGKYGRWLATVYFENMNINYQLMDEGLAKEAKY